MTLIHYFAYGSNLHPLRLRERTPSARLIGHAAVVGYRLYFHKRGVDGSAKCNLLSTGEDKVQAWGAVYTLSAADKAVLDSIEGVGRGYQVHHVTVQLAGEGHEAFMYRAQSSHIDDTLLPFSWYKELVLMGAAFHVMPKEYIAGIAQVAGVEDQDQARAARYLRLLENMRCVR